MPDPTYTAQLSVSDAFRPLEICTTLGLNHLIILYPMQKLAKRLERRDDI